MSRKRLLYESSAHVLDDLVNNKYTIEVIFVYRHRAKNLYNDIEQFKIIDEGIKMFQSYKKIRDIEIE